MIRKCFTTLFAVAFVAVSSQPVAAQFETGHFDIGPTIGLGGIGDAGISIGGRAEWGMKPMESLGTGILGIMGSVEIYSYDFPGGYDWSFISIGATANYHFKLTDTKIDPFVGLGLGFHIFTCDGPFGDLGCADEGGIYFIGRAGARYFISPRVALYGDIGAGAATINLGVLFKIK